MDTIKEPSETSAEILARLQVKRLLLLERAIDAELAQLVATTFATVEQQSLASKMAEDLKRHNDQLFAADKARALASKGIEITIHSHETSVATIAAACRALGAGRIVVDAGGTGVALLRLLQADGLPAVAMAKGLPAQHAERDRATLFGGRQATPWWKP